MQKDSCFNCHKQGHWARDCPSISPKKILPSVNGGGSTGSSRDHPLIQCRCGNGTCLVFVSRTERNPGRKFYSCPASSAGKCGFFKWVDEVKDSDTHFSPQKAFPKCPCGAGICKKIKEISGPNAGRSYFVCPIKKGLGACPFYQWEDTQVDTKLNEHGDESKGYGSPPLAKCDSLYRAFDIVINDLHKSDDNLNIEGLGACPFYQWEDTQVDTKLNEHGDESKGYGSPPLAKCDSLYRTFDIVINDLHKSDDNLNIEEPGRLEVRSQMVDIARVFPNSTIMSGEDVPVIENPDSGKTSVMTPVNQHDPSPFVLPEKETSVIDAAKGSLVTQEAESWDSMVGKDADGGLMSQSMIRSRQMEFWSQIYAAVDSKRDFHHSLGLHILGWLGRLAFPPSRCLTDRPPAPFYCVIFPSFDPIFLPRDRDMPNRESSTALSHCRSNNNKLSPSSHGQDVQLWRGDLQKSSGLKRASPALDENEMSTFRKFFDQARLLVNQLGTILNSTDLSDPYSMSRGADDMFCVLKSIDNNPVTKCLKEYVDSSLIFFAIEQSMLDDRSMEELVGSYNEEKVRFDDILKAYEKAVTDLTASIEHEQSLQVEASRVRELLSQIENQISRCQAETSERKTQADIISRDMLESKKSMEKAEEALLLYKQKEEELLAAKAALEKARIQLQQ